jgi:N-sulfoglucosamine sulfohydrolase
MTDLTRRGLLGGTAAITVLQATGAAGAVGSIGARPNILLILADDWAWQPEDDWDDFSRRLPTFSRIAREGVRFRNAFAAAPSCTASRGALLTGQWPWRLAEGANLASILPRRFPVYPDLLEASGYHVGYTRKGWAPGQIAPARRTRNPAGDSYADFDAFLAARPEGHPFAFWFGSADPHRPYVKGAGVAAGISPGSITVPPYLPDTPTIRADIADYRFEIERLDREAGQLLARLEQAGELDNTLVVMTGDNGWPFPRGKATLYDAGWHVPLAIMWKAEIKGGRISDAMVALPDLAPTFLDLAGVARPAAMTAQSLLPHLATGRPFSRDHVLGAMERHMDGRTNPGEGYPMRALRTADHLYIRNFRPERWPAGNPSSMPRSAVEIEAGSFAGFADIDGSPTKAELILRQADPAIARYFAGATAKRPAEQLYDIAADPWCMTDLAADPRHRALRDHMGKRLIAELRAAADPRIVGDGAIFDDYPGYSDPGYGRPDRI